MSNSHRQKLREPFLFALSGVAGFLADYITTFLISLIVSPYIARIPAFIAATLTTWQINRKYTFKGKTRYDSDLKEYAHYLGLMIFGLVANYIAFAIAYSQLGAYTFGLITSIAIGSLAGMLINFVLSKRFIYNKDSSGSHIVK